MKLYTFSFRTVCAIPVFVSFIFISLISPAQNYVWADRFGNSQDEQSNSIAVDAFGNSYITGYFIGTVDFDPGPGTDNLTSVGARDIYFSKFDANGNYLWAKQIGGVDFDEGHTITVDAAGTIYLAGYFCFTADFDPGPGTANLTMVGSGGTDIFFAKYTTNGNYIWAKSIGSVSSDNALEIQVDGSGNIYLAGLFGEASTADFDPGPGTANLTSAGKSDIFFAKYTSNGNYILAKGIGSIDYDHASGIAADGAGNIYITGGLDGPADFDPGAGTATIVPIGAMDTYIAKYDVNGNYLWAKSMGDPGGAQATYAKNIRLDTSGNICISGRLTGASDFDPGPGTAFIYSAGWSDIYLAKYDSNGNYIWAKSIGGTGIEFCYGFVLDAMGNSYITGTFQNTVDFDPGTGTANMTATGFLNCYIAKYDTSGNYLWAKSLASSIEGRGYCIAIDKKRCTYVTGNFRITCDFDPGSDTANLTTGGSFDVFVAKYSPLLVASQDPACFGQCNGSISASVSGGIPPYTYLWSNSQTTSAITGLCAGAFTVTVIDANSDTLVGTTILAQPAALSTTVNITNATSCTINNGSVFVATSGGSTPYSYSWSNGGSTSAITGLAAGNYSVTVSDAHGCTKTATATVTCPTGVEQPSAETELTIYPNPSTGLFTIHMPVGEIEIYNVFGVAIYKSEINNLKSEINLTEQPNGIYFIHIKTDQRIETRKIILNK